MENEIDHVAENVSLSDLQITLMRVLWSKPHSTTLEVVEAMRPTRALAHTTIATLLSRLEKRGLIASTKQGRLHSYHALISETQVQRSMVADLLSSLFMGNANALVKHLVREDEIDVGDLEQIQKLLSQQEKTK